MSQQDAPIPVTGPVTATVGPVWLGLFPPKTTEWNGDPDGERWEAVTDACRAYLPLTEDCGIDRPSSSTGDSGR